MLTKNSEFLSDHFSKELQRIALRVQNEGGRADLNSVFGDVDDDLYFYLLMRNAVGLDKVLSVIPQWPPEEVRTTSTSDLPLNHSMLEAKLFWDTIKRHVQRPLQGMRVADYGAGWGRISRFVAKDVPNQDLFAFEPNPVFADLYEKCHCPGNLVRTDWESQASLASYGHFDLVYCFSILTHSSHELTTRIARRWEELTKPGSLVFTTIRPRYFIEGSSGDAGLLRAELKSDMFNMYDAGELVYVPYASGGGHWGVTVMPEPYLARVFAAFDIVALHPNPLTMNQMMVVLRRK
jgi:hypothetical protein